MGKLRAIALVVGAGCLMQSLLFGAARALGLLGEDVRVASSGAQISWPAVLVATIGAMLLRVALAHVVGSHRRARRVFLLIAGAVLVASFWSPRAGLTGVTVVDVAFLDAMHAVAAIAAVMAAEWATRPHWTFGDAVYDDDATVPPVAVVTGATSGIGACVAMELARRGYRVLGIGRSPVGARALEATHEGIRVFIGDLSSMTDTSRLAAAINEVVDSEGLGILVHCAGTLKPKSVRTAEGIDENFAASFLGRFALTDRLRLAGGVRIVNVGAAHRGRLPASMRMAMALPQDIGSGMRAHGQAQLANDFWVAHLARRGLRAYGYGPGAVDTAIRREIPRVLRLLMKPVFAVDTRSPHEAARDIMRLLFDSSLPSSGFASRDGLFEHDPFIQDVGRQQALVTLARNLVANAVGPVAPRQ